MSRSATFTFSDPDAYGSCVRATNAEFLVTAKGNFRAELTQIDLPRLWMQRSSEALPLLQVSTNWPGRAPIAFLTDANQPPIRHCGIEVSPGDIIVYSQAAFVQRRSSAPCRWGGISLALDDLVAAGQAITGRDLASPSTTCTVRPPPASIARLMRLHQAAADLAKNKPDRLRQPEVAKALEDSLVHAMIACLAEPKLAKKTSCGIHHAQVMARLEEFLAANHERPLYLTEMCEAAGVSERALRICCQQHLGMSPMRYLWLRRMHLTRRALLRGNPATSTVTAIATDHGFWELGRFSVAYRSLFGETPSATLRRSSDDPPTSKNPLALSTH